MSQHLVQVRKDSAGAGIALSDHLRPREQAAWEILPKHGQSLLLPPRHYAPRKFRNRTTGSLRQEYSTGTAKFMCTCGQDLLPSPRPYLEHDISMTTWVDLYICIQAHVKYILMASIATRYLLDTIHVQVTG